MQQVDRLIAVFGQELGRDGDGVDIGGKAEGRGEIVARPGEALRIEIACAFLDQGSHQVDGPFLADGIKA